PLGDRVLRLPGIGSYMSVAIDRGDGRAMTGAVVAMVVMIVVVDQLLWRPLLAWAQRFKLEDTSASDVARSWFLDLLRRSRALSWIEGRLGRIFAALEGRGGAGSPGAGRVGVLTRGAVGWLGVAIPAAWGLPGARQRV